MLAIYKYNPKSNWLESSDGNPVSADFVNAGDALLKKCFNDGNWSLIRRDWKYVGKPIWVIAVLSDAPTPAVEGLVICMRSNQINSGDSGRYFISSLASCNAGTGRSYPAMWGAIGTAQTHCSSYGERDAKIFLFCAPSMRLFYESYGFDYVTCSSGSRDARTHNPILHMRLTVGEAPLPSLEKYIAQVRKRRHALMAADRA